MTQDEHVARRLASLRGLGLLVGLIGAAVCAAAMYFWPAEFFRAYLIAWLYWWSISVGALAIAMIHHLTGGLWGLAIRRILEAAYSLVPLLAILFVPLLFGLPTLYHWARPEEVASDTLLQHKSPYLNVTAFQWRAAGYFVAWSLLGIALNALSTGRAEDEPVRSRRLALVSGPGLIVWGLTVTFAAIDWSMSLEPHWFSSSYGVLVGAGQGVAAMSLAIAVLVGVRDLPAWSGWATIDCLNDLGNFLLAFVMFWTYIAFTQFLIIWSGNLPEEAPWYLNRSAGGWQWVAALLAVFHFAVPFLLLLARGTKRHPRRLLIVALVLLTMRLVDWNWLVTPAFHPAGLAFSWIQIAALAGVGGIWLAAFAWRLAARAALPVYELLLEGDLADVRHARAIAGD
jgi:hypothetical protein